MTQILIRQCDPVCHPLDVPWERAAGRAQAFQTGIAAEGFIRSREEAISARIGSQQAAECQNTSSWGPQFVNNGVVTNRP
jgi:hypothetical protein